MKLIRLVFQELMQYLSTFERWEQEKKTMHEYYTDAERALSTPTLRDIEKIWHEGWGEVGKAIKEGRLRKDVREKKQDRS